MTMIKIDSDLCKGCDICREFCPEGVYVRSEELNRKGVHEPVPKNLEECTGCKLCMLLCPDQAIVVYEDD
ncbi:ferredoxin [Methanothermobacter thermautotrophicus]|jgi:2-oxoglutarate ferredoxin oxidoreductase subunit delta|uniref:Ferredoxin n=2 Tax=Methanothermobacter thermautotrophicus TaxID=145262 RepID=A0A842YQY7_METTF|nr:ferredoxin [Methanothermobacter thermautotrophicus]